MAELVRVVLDAPASARLAHQVGPQFGADDFVDAAAALDDDGAVEVAEHRLAHRVETAVRSAQADAGGDREILKRIRLVGDLPGMADRCGVAGRAQDDLGAAVGGLTRHLGEHAVVADDQPELDAARPDAHRHAQVARLPGLNRHPGVQLAVVQLDLALVVDDQAAVVRVAVGVGLHDREAAPDAVLHASRLERRHLGAVQRDHQLGRDAHAQAVQRVLGKHHQVHRGQVAPRLADHLADALRLRRQLRGRLDQRQMQLHQADHHAIRRLVQTTQSTHVETPNSIGAPLTAR